MPDKKLLKHLDRDFAIPLSTMRKIIRDFHSEMDKGLRGSASSLKMIPTCVDKPTGGEKGKFLAFDLGGTNFRVVQLELRGRSRAVAPQEKKCTLDKKYINGTSDEFFDFLADCIKKFTREQKIGPNENREAGFTFSFPIKQRAIASGVLLNWTKGFSAKGVVGRDVVRLLNNALLRKGLANIRISALVNDTVGTLVSKAYEDEYCDIGVILGTGTNACYVEKLSNIVKWQNTSYTVQQMIVNIEWGNFNKLPLTEYDKALDKESNNQDEQVLEKMVSGMYLGVIAGIVCNDLIDKKIILNGHKHGFFNEPINFKSEYMSVIEGDHSPELKKTRLLLNKLGIRNSSLKDREVIKYVCQLVSRRGARISAAALAAVVTKIDPKISRKHTIAVDGSLYEKHPGFSKAMMAALRQVFKKRIRNINLSLVKDGSGRGAAIIASLSKTYY